MYQILHQPLECVHGIGSQLSRKLAGRGMHCLGDLLLHLPHSYIDDRIITKIADLQATISQRVQGIIVKKSAHGYGRKRQVTLLLADETGSITLRFFHSGYMMSDARLSEGRQVMVRGVAELWQGRWQMTHPDWCLPEQFTPGFRACYGMLAGVSGKRIAAYIQKTLQMLPVTAASPLDARYDGLTLRQAWVNLHTPEALDETCLQQAAKRLKQEELHVYFHLMQEQRVQAQCAAPALQQSTLCEQFLQQLPYKLTAAQQMAWQDIHTDLQRGVRMHRLLQGDVGSGKTWLAALAMLNAVDSGYQAALMAPTEVLAKQHFETLQAVFEPLGVELALLSGSTSKSKRKKMMARLTEGDLPLLVGTHALLSDDVIFHRLALVLIDEQHRFGVRQRWALAEKADAVHLLAMTATPIPRTLALAVYGDLDLSVMRGKPPGRKPVETRVISMRSLESLYQGMQRILSQQGRIYWIVPRITQDNEECGEATVEARVQVLQQRFPTERVQGLHGQMKAQDKNAVLDSFSTGDCRLLVSTTVVEVGVNVPEARLMIIEQAESYGLAQLHQLRGRVGRSDIQSFCMLLASEQAGSIAFQRLQQMVDSDDGFVLAEADLQMRGAGDAIGLRQSGEAGFKLLDPANDANLITEVYEEFSESPSGGAICAEMIQFWRSEVDIVD